jgi:hypothetical protein
MKEKSCLFKFYADLVGFRGVRFGKRLIRKYKEGGEREKFQDENSSDPKFKNFKTRN